MNGLGGEMDVLAAQNLGDDAPLRGQPPSSRPQAFEQVAHLFRVVDRLPRGSVRNWNQT
jgi:hypothetical protein